jgi:hypothetical protein
MFEAMLVSALQRWRGMTETQTPHSSSSTGQAYHGETVAKQMK